MFYPEPLALQQQQAGNIRITSHDYSSISPSDRLKTTVKVSFHLVSLAVSGQKQVFQWHGNLNSATLHYETSQAWSCAFSTHICVHTKLFHGSRRKEVIVTRKACLIPQNFNSDLTADKIEFCLFYLRLSAQPVLSESEKWVTAENSTYPAFPNQLPMTATTQGQPVDCSKPFTIQRQQ